MKLHSNIPFISFLLLLTVYVYQPITGLGFANVDDPWALLDYEMVHPEVFHFTYIKELFTSFYSYQYAPVNVLYYSMIYQINGYDPYWFHLFNFLVHLFNILLVYTAVKTIYDIFSIAQGSILAFVVCVIWAVHPLNIESVVWISASKVVLFAAFALLSFIFYLKNFVSKKKAYLGLSIFCFILSCFCKEQAVLLSPAIYIFIFAYKMKYPTFNASFWYLRCLPFLFISLIFGIVSIQASLGSESDTPLPYYSLIERVVFAAYSFCFYLFNSILPVDLHFHYPFPIKPGEKLPTYFYVFPLFLVSLAVYGVKSLKNDNNKAFYLFCILFFVINLLLCVHLFPIRRFAIMADRYMYLPTIGILIIVIFWVHNLFASVRSTNIKFFMIVGLAIIVGAMAYYSRTLVNNWFYQML